MAFTHGKVTKGAIGAAAAAAALLGVGGVAFAEGGAPDAPQAQQAQQHGQHKHHGHHKHHGKHHPLAGLEHGEFTKSTNKGEKTFDLQRGTVVASSPDSLTVRSKDGFTATYAADPGTKVHKQRKDASITEVKPGEHVAVRAVKDGARTVARQIHDSGAAKPALPPGQGGERQGQQPAQQPAQQQGQQQGE